MANAEELHIAILDGYAINPGDLSFKSLDQFGSVLQYDNSTPEQIIQRSQACQVVIVNKVHLSKEIIEQLPNLELICLFATGYDNVDLDAARARGIAVYNARGYGSESVAQHVMAMLLTHTNRVEQHNQSVKADDWTRSGEFSYSLHTVTELKGKSLGIIGYGQIGHRVGELAEAFGMKILVLERGKDHEPGIEPLPLTDLLARADFVSLHTPLTAETRHIINRESLASMKSTCVLINTGRGGLVDEQALAHALAKQDIAAAYLDVMVTEPPSKTHPSPLMALPNCFITPHMAWRALEARTRLLQITVENIHAFLHDIPSANRLA